MKYSLNRRMTGNIKESGNTMQELIQNMLNLIFLERNDRIFFPTQVNVQKRIILRYYLNEVTGRKVKSMQRPGKEAIITQIQPSKPKREITKIANRQQQIKHMVNRVSSSFPKDGHSANPTELKQ